GGGDPLRRSADHGEVSLFGLGQAEYGGLGDWERAERAGLKARLQSLEDFGAIPRGEGQSVDPGEFVATPIESEDIERNRSLDGRYEDLAPTFGHRLAGRFKVRAADGVVDHVGAVAVRLVADVRGNVGSRGINHLDGGGCMPAEFLTRALYRENARPPHSRKLDCRLTHLAVAPEYEDHVPSFAPAGFDQPVVGGDERDSECSRLAQ